MSGGYRRVRAPKGAPIAHRLELHSLVAPSGCRVWIGARSEAGYGRVQFEGQTLYAHRASYELHVGPIPDGLQIDHLCRRPACIEPRHLQAVSPSVNTLRGTSPGARATRNGSCFRGHRHAEYGFERDGRTYCRACKKIYAARYRAARLAAKAAA